MNGPTAGAFGDLADHAAEGLNNHSRHRTALSDQPAQEVEPQAARRDDDSDRGAEIVEIPGHETIHLSQQPALGRERATANDDLGCLAVDHVHRIARL